jgi:lincosamide nucleotidyltransferase A/C/D/E
MQIPMKFPAQDVVRIFRLLEEGGVPAWVEGGWGVDALLKRETRAHRDIDVIVPLDHLAAAESELGKVGFLKDERETNMPTRFVLRNSEGLMIDIHPVTFQSDGSAVHVDTDVGGQKYLYVYSPVGLSGVGIVDGRVIRCTTAAEQIRQKVERHYSPWSDHRLRERGVSADLEDISCLLQAFGVHEGMVTQTAPTPEAQPMGNPVVHATEQFCLRRVALLTTQHTELAAQHSLLTAQHTELAAQHSLLTAQHTELAAQHSLLIAQHAELGAKINALWASTSWQLTAPMRWIVKGLGLDWLRARTQ